MSVVNVGNADVYWKVKEFMKKWLFRIVFLIFLAVFIFSAVSILRIYLRYREGRKIYQNVANEFVMPVTSTEEDSDDLPVAEILEIISEQTVDESQSMVMEAESSRRSITPFEVDFEALKKINEDIVGWIYCKGTAINYPLLQTSDNNYYLHKSYDRSYLFNGSIFVEAKNRPVFLDTNTIIYGHNMQDGSMFADLENWQSQSFYEEHPYMWIFTPQQDYVVVLFSGYTTHSTSDSYQIFSDPNDAFYSYLQTAVAQSDFTADVELDLSDTFVLLSTCSYAFDNSRYVLHGMLVPVGTAGGKPVAPAE